MIELNHIYNMDCLEGMKQIPDKSIDLVVCDPPYLIGNQGGGFWSKAKEGNHYNARGTRKGMDKLNDIKDGINEVFLDKICQTMKHINIYIFCSQKQIQQYLDYFVTEKNATGTLYPGIRQTPSQHVETNT